MGIVLLYLYMCSRGPFRDYKIGQCRRQPIRCHVCSFVRSPSWRATAEGLKTVPFKLCSNHRMICTTIAKVQFRHSAGKFTRRELLNGHTDIINAGLNPSIWAAPCITWSLMTRECTWQRKIPFIQKGPKVLCRFCGPHPIRPNCNTIGRPRSCICIQ